MRERRLAAAIGVAVVGAVIGGAVLGGVGTAEGQGGVRVTATQLLINQRISQAGVKRSNEALQLLTPVRAVGGRAATGWTTANLASGAVTSAKLANAAVTGPRIATGAITAPKIAAGAVGTQQIATGGVGQSDIATGAVGNGQIANDAVNAAKLAPNAVGTSQIANGVVTNAKLGAGSVGTSQIGNNAVTGAKIADGTIAQANLNAAVQAQLTTKLGAVVTPAAALVRGFGVVSVARDAAGPAGVYDVAFNRDVSGCLWSAQAGTSSAAPSTAPFTTQVDAPAGPEVVRVWTWNAQTDALADSAFMLTVLC